MFVFWNRKSTFIFMIRRLCSWACATSKESFVHVLEWMYFCVWMLKQRERERERERAKENCQCTSVRVRMGVSMCCCAWVGASVCVCVCVWVGASVLMCVRWGFIFQDAKFEGKMRSIRYRRFQNVPFGEKKWKLEILTIFWPQWPESSHTSNDH